MTAVRGRALVLPGLGLLGWAAYATISGYAILEGWRVVNPIHHQIDWHVYAAGALDLLDRSLYREPLWFHGLSLPVPHLNLPPMAAAWALPLAWLPPIVGGMAWQAAMAAALAVATVLVARITAVPRPWLVAGIVLGAYAFHASYLDGLVGGTNNHLVLVLVAGFAWAQLAGRHRSAGTLLGLAVATKLWPVVLCVWLVRERRWQTLRWTGGLLALQAVVFLAWLGTDVVDEAVSALRVTAATQPNVIGLSALREVFAWWPAWVGPMLAVALLALPVTGRAGIGLGMLAGMALVPNLWMHYLPTVVAACALAWADLSAALRRRRERRLAGSGAAAGPRPPEPVPQA